MKLKHKLNNTTNMDDWPKDNIEKLFTGLIEATTRLEDTQKERLEQEEAFNTILMVMEETLTKLDETTLKRDDVNTEQLDRVLWAVHESLKRFTNGHEMRDETDATDTESDPDEIERFWVIISDSISRYLNQMS